MGRPDMATATAQRPITEADIRNHLAVRSEQYPHDNPRKKMAEAISEAFDPIGYVQLSPEDEAGFGSKVLSDLWDDLRPSEAKRLHDLIAEHVKEALEASWAAVVSEVVAAALTFAAEYPDAPRATA
jgi:hypothetical protein